MRSPFKFLTSLNECFRHSLDYVIFVFVIGVADIFGGVIIKIVLVPNPFYRFVCLSVRNLYPAYITSIDTRYRVGIWYAYPLGQMTWMLTTFRLWPVTPDDVSQTYLLCRLWLQGSTNCCHIDTTMLPWISTTNNCWLCLFFSSPKIYEPAVDWHWHHWPGCRVGNSCCQHKHVNDLQIITSQ